MSVIVKIKQTVEVEVTAENELSVVTGEWDRRYLDRALTEGDPVEFSAIGRAKHIEAFGPEHIGKRGVVAALGEGDSVKVLAITTAGEFIEIWTPEAILVAIPNAE
jgi:hypothetical protein